MSERLSRVMVHFNWKYIAGAVLDVFRENKARDAAGTSRRTASSDDWGIRKDLRREVWKRSACFWSERTGEDREEFPYNVDCTVRIYMKYRKRNPDELDTFYRELNDCDTGLFSHAAST